MKGKKTFAMVAVLGLCACATNNVYQQGLDTWIGLSSQQLVSSWGPPTSEADMSNGHTMLTYEPKAIYYFHTYVDTTTFNSKGHTTYAGGGADLDSTPPNCTTHFEIDANSSILNWRTEGDRCIVK